MPARGLIPATALALLIASCGRDDDAHGLVRAVAKGQKAPEPIPAATPAPASPGSPRPAAPAPAADSPFIGAWDQSGATERRAMRIRFTLTADGLYLAFGEIEDLETGEHAQIAVHGRWFAQGDTVTMIVESTSQPALFAPSSVMTYAQSDADGTTWRYTDASGRPRSMTRVGADARADAERGR